MANGMFKRMGISHSPLEQEGIPVNTFLCVGVSLGFDNNVIRRIRYTAVPYNIMAKSRDYRDEKDYSAVFRVLKPYKCKEPR